jgi:opacity protein-like surface antigen
MKNHSLITGIGPHLLADHSLARSPRFGLTRGWSLLLGIAIVFAVFWMGLSVARAQNASDPMVMKIYPDGTKVALRWSEVGKLVDNGEKFGGAPRIVAYDPAKDGIVPIGEPAKTTATTATNTAVPSSSSVVSPEQPQKMDYSDADPDQYGDDFGPREGFVFRTAAGAAFQQPLSGRSGSGTTYEKFVFQPGIRYDLEAQYNVTDWFRTGVETAFVYNQLHSLTLNNTVLYNNSTAIGNGGLFQVPILYSANFRFPSEGPVQGYLGGGVGANWNVLQVSIAGTRPYTSYHWNWAWQVTAGFTYCVAPGLDLDIGYKLLSSPNPNFADLGQFKASYNHTAEIGLAWRF